MGKSVAVDFDGTISHYYKWTGPYKFGAPIDGVKEFLESLKERDLKILVYSCRAKTPQIIGAMKKWMDEHELPYDSIYHTGYKPDAVAYIDDKGISVQPQKHGKKEYDKALKALDELIAWKKKEKTL